MKVNFHTCDWYVYKRMCKHPSLCGYGGIAMDRKKYLHLCISWFVVLLLLQVVIPGCSRNILTIRQNLLFYLYRAYFFLGHFFIQIIWISSGNSML